MMLVIYEENFFWSSALGFSRFFMAFGSSPARCCSLNIYFAAEEIYGKPRN